MVSTRQHQSSRPCYLSTMNSGSKIPVWIPFVFLHPGLPSLSSRTISTHLYELHLWLHIPLVPWILVPLPSAWTSWTLVLSMFLPTLRSHVPMACCWPCLTYPNWTNLPSGHQDLSTVMFQNLQVSLFTQGLWSQLHQIFSSPILSIHSSYNTSSKLGNFSWCILIFSLSALGLASCLPEVTGLPTRSLSAPFCPLTFSWHLLHLLVLPSCFKEKQPSCPTHLFQSL